MDKYRSLAAGILCLYYLSLLPWRVRSQYFHDPEQHFKPLKFDMELRGSYNISQCVSDNLNCWEVVKPDLICGNSWHYPSACDVLLEYCHDLVDGYDQTGYYYSMQVQEQWCNGWEAYTK